MKDVEINKKFGIPVTTLQDWKKADKDTWRNKVYLHLKNPASGKGEFVGVLNKFIENEKSNTRDLEEYKHILENEKI